MSELLLPVESDDRDAKQATQQGRSSALFERGFRPFFLGAGIYAAVVIPVWLAIWRGALPAPAWLVPAWWHGHELLFGTVVAAIAGFLLTAVPVWAGRPALRGRPLMALVGLWALGRIAMNASGVLPLAVVAALDVAFLPALALVLVRTLRGTRQLRNYGVVALVGLLALANAALHANALGFGVGSAAQTLRFSVDVVVILIVVIGGRITPGFTTNALLRRGVAARAKSPPVLDLLAIAATAATAWVGLVTARGVASGILAALAALAVAVRMAGWQTLHTWRDPLVWSLHAGMAWVALGLGLVAAGDLASSAPLATAGLHALAAGAMGSMILAVMTRVSLGHTGRPLVLPRGAVVSYALVHAGAAARVASALVPGADEGVLLLAGGVLWAAAFLLFVVRYAAILVQPRIDGLEG